MALLLATDTALLAEILDLVLPRLLDQMQADRRMAMVQGCDRSLARVLGWLVTSLRCFVKTPYFGVLTVTLVISVLDIAAKQLVAVVLVLELLR